jgi:hypothetical protein
VSNMVIASPDIVADFRKQLLDQTVPIAQRFRTLFSLRNCSGDEAREALEAGVFRLSFVFFSSFEIIAAWAVPSTPLMRDGYVLVSHVGTNFDFPPLQLVQFSVC